MANLTVALGTFVDRTLNQLTSPNEQGFRVVMGSNALTSSASDTTFTLADATGVNVSDVLEFGSELVLITAKSAAATPVFTCARGYFRTTVAAAALDTVGLVNPAHPRIQVAEAVRRSFSRLEALGIPYIRSDVKTRATDLQQIITLLVQAREILQVLYVDPETGIVSETNGWKFYKNLPTTEFALNNVLKITALLDNDDELIIVWRAPYRWSTHPTTPTEAATIEILEGCEDLPTLYAAAWMVARREISRTEIDRSEEYLRSEPVRTGGGAALARAMWGEFYSSVDMARRLEPAPVHRPYRRMPRYGMG